MHIIHHFPPLPSFVPRISFSNSPLPCFHLEETPSQFPLFHPSTHPPHSDSHNSLQRRPHYRHFLLLASFPTGREQTERPEQPNAPSCPRSRARGQQANTTTRRYLSKPQISPMQVKQAETASYRIASHCIPFIALQKKQGTDMKGALRPLLHTLMWHRHINVKPYRQPCETQA